MHNDNVEFMRLLEEVAEYNREIENMAKTSAMLLEQVIEMVSRDEQDSKSYNARMAVKNARMNLGVK